MASLVLGVVGNAIGGPIGGFIGATIGSWIDGQLFPQKQEGPRLSDLSVTTSTLGISIPWLFGPENRLAPNVIWSTPLKETKTKKKQGGKGGPTVEVTEYTYSVSCALLLGKGEIRGVRKVWANNKVLFEEKGPLQWVYTGASKGEEQALFSSMRIYPGSKTQLADPTIQADVGVLDCPAYRGRAYVVIENLQLADFGNRIPNFEVLVEADDTVSVGEIARRIMAECDIDPMVCSVRVPDLVRGYMLGRSVTGTGALEPLAIAYNFDVAEVAGELRLQSRDAGPVAAIPLEELAARDQSSRDIPDRLEWERQKETELPREASLTYSDPERDWQPNTQRAGRVAGNAQNNIDSELALVLTADKAREVCDRLLWEAWTARETAKAKADQRHIHILPGRTYVFETAAGWEPLRVQRKTRGWNGLIDLELRRDRAEVYQSQSKGAVPVLPPNELKLPGESTLQIIDGPLLADADDNPGFYYAIRGDGDGWRGANVMRSPDEADANYEVVDSTGAESVMGTVEAFGDPGGAAGIFDRVTRIIVTLDSAADSFESITPAEARTGRNAIWVGQANGKNGEVLQFLNATELSAGEWELSGLYRGLRGTEALLEHPAGHRLVLLEPGILQRLDFGINDIRRPHRYKAASLLLPEPTDPGLLFLNEGTGLEPFSPVQVRPHFDGTDLHITWQRRTRYEAPDIGRGAAPLGEADERYAVRFRDGGPSGTPLEPVLVVINNGRSITVTAAQLAAYGYAPGDTAWFEVNQVGQLGGANAKSSKVVV